MYVCVYSGLTSLSTIFQSYHGVHGWGVGGSDGLQVGVGGGGTPILSQYGYVLQ